MKIEAKLSEERALGLDLILDAPRRAVWRCWTEPELMVQWFTPKPWSTARAEVDLRPGGSSLIVMRDPEGKEFPNPGVYLEVVPEERLVFTDAFVRAWEPSAKPFMTASVTLADAPGGGTRYEARALHWAKEDRDQHEKMGFFDGWATAAQQLEDLAKTL